MKMRVICYSKKKKMEQFCDAIATAQGMSKYDTLPLAYPCDKERLTIFAASVPNEDLSKMMLEITKERSANVAFLIDGPEGSAKEYMELLKKADASKGLTNIIDKVMYVRCGKISFLDKMKEDEKTAVVNWANEVVASIK